MSAQIEVSVVMSIARIFPVHNSIALCVVSFFGSDNASYKIIALLTAVPNKTTRAITLFTLIDCLVRKKKKKAPENAGGIARRSKRGRTNDSNCTPMVQ